MNSDINQLILDKRGLFEDTYRDIIIWYKYNENLNSWHFRMLDKKNKGRFIERLISKAQIEYASFDILSSEFNSMRKELIK